MKHNKVIIYNKKRSGFICWCVICSILVLLLISSIVNAQEPERISKKEAKAI